MPGFFFSPQHDRHVMYFEPHVRENQLIYKCPAVSLKIHIPSSIKQVFKTSYNVPKNTKGEFENVEPKARVVLDTF